MTEKTNLPAFENEAAEAQWWFDNREARGEEVAQAIRNGQAGRNTLAARVAASRAAIRLNPEDVATAQDLASRRGLDYEEFVKKIVHEALQREASRAA